VGALCGGKFKNNINNKYPPQQEQQQKQTKFKRYPSKRPQTVCGSGKVMYDNVDDDDDGDADDDDEHDANDNVTDYDVENCGRIMRRRTMRLRMMILRTMILRRMRMRMRMIKQKMK